jgi:hypothetical protein
LELFGGTGWTGRHCWGGVDLAIVLGFLVVVTVVGYALSRVKHTLGKADPRGVDSLEFDAARIADKWGADGAFELLVDRGLGPDLDRPLAEADSFLPYDAPPEEADGFTTFVDAMIDIYFLPDVLYRLRQGAHRALGGRVSALSDLRQRLSREPLYWKIYGQKFNDQSRLTNCNHDPDDVRLPLTCVYGDVVIRGDDPFLDGTVLTHGGTRSDLMSYVVPLDRDQQPNWTPEAPEKAFTARQIEIMRVYHHAPWMGGYRNFALAP